MYKYLRLIAACLLISSMASGHNKCIVLHYPFQGNAKDANSAGVDGTVYGAVLAMDRDNQPNSAYTFNGQASYIDLGNHYLLKRSENDFSISVWVYLEKYSEGSRSVIWSNQVSGEGSGLSIGGLNRDRLQFEVEGQNTASILTGNTVLALRQWYFVTVTFTFVGSNANIVMLYVNGQLDITGVMADIPEPVTAPTFIGYEPRADANISAHFSGMIDEVTMSQCVLNDQQILASFYPCKYVASYPFIADADDVSPNEIHGTAYGTILTDSRDGLLNNAYNFDGSTSFIDLGSNPLLKRAGGDFSLTAWIQLKNISEGDYLVVVSNRHSANTGYVLSIGGTMGNKGTVQLEIGNGISNFLLTGSSVLEVGEWYLISATFRYSGDTGNIGSLYVNGFHDTSTELPELQDKDDTLTFIGAQPAAFPTNFFLGAIDEVNIYDCLLTEEQIQNTYETAINTTTGIDNQKPTGEIYVFPNPGNGRVNVQVQQAAAATIVNEIGQVVRQFTLDASNNYTGMVDGLRPGFYSIVCRSSIHVLSRKFVVIP